MAENKDLKQLKIKTAGIKRIQKEYSGYQQEEAKQIERVQKLEAAMADEHDIKKQKEVLQETIKMYPNIIQRLQDALADLNTWLQEKQDDPLINSSSEKEDAHLVIDNAKLFLYSLNPAY